MAAATDWIDNARTPQERIVAVDLLAAAFNHEKFLKDKKRIVDLECGHKAYTGNLSKVVCARCTEMLRRSLRTGEEDYESFRAGRTRDQMIWCEDPLRQFHEPTDLEGNFVND